ncbi:hypothetical protein EWB00_002495 [Schistosoma japonicum]|uniref:Uncharacterized protein n=1 Tax=Schistosoma japonicum TaxID=6182 RepID=A0A4Z2DBT3_SCHJA|nr:hypothetical protein EWB00_002495 [Schistosoma japonicum]
MKFLLSCRHIYEIFNKQNYYYYLNDDHADLDVDDWGDHDDLDDNHADYGNDLDDDVIRIKIDINQVP